MTVEIKSFDDFQALLHDERKAYKIGLLHVPYCMICKRLRKKFIKWADEEKYANTGFFTCDVADVPGLCNRLNGTSQRFSLNDL